MRAGRSHRESPSRASTGLLPFSLAFYEGDVTVDWQVRKTLNCSARQWPLHFYPIELGSFSNSQDNARVMSRQITSAADFHPAPLQVLCLIRYARAHCIRVRLAADQ